MPKPPANNFDGYRKLVICDVLELHVKEFTSKLDDIRMNEQTAAIMVMPRGLSIVRYTLIAPKFNCSVMLIVLVGGRFDDMNGSAIKTVVVKVRE